MSHQTIVPFFSIDIDRLRSLLEDANGSRTLRENPTTRTRLARNLSRRSSTFSIGDHAGIGLDVMSESSPLTDKLHFLVECEVQVRKLFNFLDQHLTKAERDLAVLFSMQAQREKTSDANNHTSIQLEESGSPRGRESAVFHASRLKHLRDVLVSLQVTLQTSFEALEKLATKYDRGSPTPDGRAFLESKTQRKVELEVRLSACLRKTNAWLHVFYDHSDQNQPRRRKKVTFLEKPSALTHIQKERTASITGLYVTLFLALSTVTVSMYFLDGTSTWVVFFRMVRSPLLIILYLFLLALNMKVWAQTNIDYISAFGFPSDGIATPNYMLRVAGLFTVLFAVLIAAFLVISPFTFVLPGKLIPLVMWVVLLVFLVNPLNVYLYHGRKSFVYVLLRIVASPLTESKFGEIWLAIQLNSLGVVLLDLEYTLCYAVQSPWSGEMDPRVCTGSENTVRPLIASLPAILQLLQNLRIFADRRKWRFLVNAVKFLTSFPIIIFATLFSVNLPDTPHFHLEQITGNTELEWLGGTWLIFALLNGGYAFAWDVCSDWGLLCFSKWTVLRPILLYRWKCLYFLSMLLDLIFRSFWALEITLALVWRYNYYTDMIYTGLVVGEMLRCFVWNFFRLEHQQIQRLNN